MSQNVKEPAAHMASEIAEAPMVFAKAVAGDHLDRVASLNVAGSRAIYTIARGSSDAVANIISYEAMKLLKRPVTSLPPSAFSIFGGVDVDKSLALLISQSGASDDLVHSARYIESNGGKVIAITNKPGSAVEAEASVTLPIKAGPENAVPATKTVIGSIAAGMALLAALNPEYKARCAEASHEFANLANKSLPSAGALQSALLRARHIYVIGRGAGYGASHEVALKIKETCALHAEAYSASEVLHGPLQLATNKILVIVLDTGEAETQDSLNQAEKRFKETGADIFRLHPSDAGVGSLVPPAAAAALLYLVYPVILSTALALGHDPDSPETLAKETLTT